VPYLSFFQPAVNFINVKRARFSYERHFGSFLCMYVLKKAAETTFVQLTIVRMYNSQLYECRTIVQLTIGVVEKSQRIDQIFIILSSTLGFLMKPPLNDLSKSTTNRILF
jgi:hypothetical protein